MVSVKSLGRKVKKSPGSCQMLIKKEKMKKLGNNLWKKKF